MNWRALLLLVLALPASLAAPFSTNANRLTYLDSSDPFYPGLHFPKLLTPEWAGEEGVEAVVILSIDDMRHNEAHYESYLRPILERLKQIDGRAPVSILVNTTSATNAQNGAWLKEGLSLECHTIAHPCPLCQKGDFAAAAKTYHDCVDLLASVPGNRPVAFRMPCCDSMNSPTPRFYAEIFNRTSPHGNHLTIDSSVMVILTTNDASLPRELVLDADGRERFRKYLPAQTNAATRVSMGSFTTTIEDYPYPYAIGGAGWEFPCIVPSDWEAQNLHGVNNPRTVEDWKRALDAVVRKQGVMTFVFHPHGWIQATQMVEFIDYAAAQYGRRVKFLNFREAEERLTRSVGNLRDSGPSPGNAPILLDLNNDGLLDVMRSRTWWFAKDAARHELPFTRTPQTRFGVLSNEVIAFPLGSGTAWRFRDGAWVEEKALLHGLAGAAAVSTDHARDRGVRLRDVDNDGMCELLVANEEENALFHWSPGERTWKRAPFALPPDTRIVDAEGRDAGLRFVDVNGDGFDDVIFSDDKHFSLHLFRKDSRDLRLKPGWTDEVISGTRSNALTDAIPPIVRAGPHRNNGVWFKNGTMWIQNEDTAHLPDKVDRRAFADWLTRSHPRALSPEESLKAMRVRPGFRVELVASEPLIADPVAFEWSADGRLWVVEMADYPTAPNGQPLGRIRVLEDADGDGRYDKGTTFLDGLNCPTGIHPWRDGVVISAAPDIFFARQNADGSVTREVLFTGFTPGNQQHRVNGFDYGLDGWLYGANGDSGGNIRAPGAKGEAVNIRGRDFRLHPDRRAFEGIEGQTQFGRHRDDFGNWFGNNNPTWAWHYFFPERYLARNPLLPLKTTKRLLANYEGGLRCYPGSRLMTRFNDAHTANHVTSGCSVAPYRDELFGGDFARSLFICEPVHNLVHREVLEPDGVTFQSRRAADERESEFLASTDNWFRPVFARTGPDGALYIADMYRLVIEHPEWIPAEMQGRIYRVLPEGAERRRVPNSAKLTTVELVEALTSPNGWQRDTAQRLLLERGDRTAVAPLTRHATNAPDARVRVQALWTLHGLGALAPETLAAALRDGDARVREHAVRLAEFSSDVAPLLALARDPAVRVRYQLAFTLGEFNDARAAKALGQLTGDSDEHVRNAALSSAPRHAQAMLAALEPLPPAQRPAGVETMLRKLIANPARTAPAVKLVERNPITPEQRAERAAVLARYGEVPKLRGHARAGAALFAQQCAQCHRLRGEGFEVGPDLGMMAGKPAEQLVVAILDPNAALEQRYRSVTARLRDGRELSGILTSETPTTVTLRAAGQGDETILRLDLAELESSSLSLMPEGFEAALTPQQLADLIAYVLGQ